MDELISKQAAIDAICDDFCGGHLGCVFYKNCENLNTIKALPSAHLNNKVNLCDSCSHTYPDCRCDNVIFGTGKGMDNICACSQYKPRQTINSYNYGWICPVCGKGLSPITVVCPCQNAKGWEITCKM